MPQISAEAFVKWTPERGDFLQEFHPLVWKVDQVNKTVTFADRSMFV